MKSIFLFALALTCHLILPSQCTAQDAVKESSSTGRHNYDERMMPWDSAKLGTRFTMSGIYKTVDGKSIDFSNLHHPTFVCFGFYGCHPCERELPSFIDLSYEHPETNFVYVTFDSEETRIREFKEAGKSDFKANSNYYIIHMDRKDIDRQELAMGYPYKYFLNAAGIIKYVVGGGNTDEKPEDFKDRMVKVMKRP